MKSIHFIRTFLSLCLFTASFLVEAQSAKDSLTIYIENRVELKIEIDDFNNLREPNDIAKQLSVFQGHLKTIKGQLNSEDADLVNYTPDSLIIVEKMNKQNIFLIQNEKAINTGFRDKAILHIKKNMTISLTAADLSKIDDILLSDCFNKMVQKLPQKTRALMSLYFQCKDGELLYLEDKTTATRLDAIELTFGAGASLLKNKWVGDLNFRIGVLLNKKGKLQHYPYVSTSLLYDFPSADKVNINTFLNLGYRWGVSDSDAKIETVGAEFGYLISRQGDAFKEGTFRFSLNWNPLDAVSFSPQIYFPGGIKNAYPGVRIGFGF